MSLLRIKELEAQLARRDERIAELEQDAARMRSICAEVDKMDPKMPVWVAMCEAMGNGCNGDGMRAAIDVAMPPNEWGLEV